MITSSNATGRSIGHRAVPYNPDAAPEVWEHEPLKRFGDQAGPHAMRGVQLASQVLPHIVAASYLYSGFPTTGGAGPENGAQGTLPIYAALEEGSDIEQFENVRDTAKRLLKGGVTSMRIPQEMSYWFAHTSAAILRELAEAQKTASPQSKEFQATAADLRILAGLARYHSARLLGGVAYNLYKMSGDLAAFDEAIEQEKRAIQAWSDMVEGAGDVYSPVTIFLPPGRPWPTHWKQALGWLNDAYAQLLAERKAATGNSGVKHVAVPAFDPTAKFPTATLLPARRRLSARRVRYLGSLRQTGCNGYASDTATSINRRTMKRPRCSSSRVAACIPERSPRPSSIPSGTCSISSRWSTGPAWVANFRISM